MESYDDLYDFVCRVCLSHGKKENMVSLSDKNSKDGLSDYGKAVIVFANIFIDENDQLPKRMCQNCLKILKYAIYFKLKCESSDKQLSRLFKTHKESGSNLKETIVDYLIFKQYFPEKSLPKISSKVSKSKSDKRNTDINEKLGSGCDNSCIYNEITENTLEDSDRDSTEEEINILEKMVGQSSNIKPKNSTKSQVDKELSMLEKMVMPKRELKNCKIVKRKSLQMKKVLLSQKKLHLSQRQRNGISLTDKSTEKLICKICQKELANQHTYRYHMERHNGCKFICEHCGKGFPVLVELNMHQVSRHGTGPFLQCPHCTYKAPRKLNLIEHIRIHTGERPYTCDKCGLTFRRSAIWKKHMVYHTEKTVQCPHCPRKFYRRSEMQSHANSIHERMYVYLCHKCDATYAKSETVRRHLTERHGIPREVQGKITRVNKGEVYGIL